MNLELDLFKSDTVVKKCQDPFYARDLYRALCNNRFFKDDKEWTCSWRESGSIVANLRNKGEDYLDFYCSGNESVVTSEIQKDLLDLGWIFKPYEPRIKPGLYKNNWGTYNPLQPHHTALDINRSIESIKDENI